MLFHLEVETTLLHLQAVLVLAMIALAVLAAEAKARGLDVHLDVVLRAVSYIDWDIIN